MSTDESAELRDSLKSLMETERELLQDRVNFLKRGIDSLSQNPAAIRFEVQISSAWQAEGEKNVKVRSSKSLPKAIGSAQKKFKKVNKRSDVQGTYHVFAVIGNESEWVFNLYFPVPQKLFSYLL